MGGTGMTVEVISIIVMNKPNIHILLVDDEPNILKTLSICFEDMGFQVTQFLDSQKAADSLSQTSYDIAFIDLKMSPLDGLQLLDEIKQHSPHTTVIIITAHGSIESAVEAIKSGAYDYLQKPFDFTELQLYTQRIVDYHLLKSEVASLKKEIYQYKSSDTIITKNKRMRELIDLARQVAETDLPVLIEGESGTGKELFAQEIYQNSSRRDKPFIKINCAAVPETLMESELFGHVKGAFTGAISDRQGRFEAADGGTVFLDEIGELSPALQAKLLRFLQHMEFERVGESKTRKVDVRVIVATNRKLEEALEDGSFREDLFYRLNTVYLKVPPLHERPDDLLLLIQYFLKKYAPEKEFEITARAQAVLCSNLWRGNVRELENAIERAVLLSKDTKIDLKDLPEEITQSSSRDGMKTLEQMEKEHIQYVLQNATDLQEAAKILGVNPSTLWRKRKRYNL
jgi:NtrC-family two-component system response regulator AlgB